DTAGIRQTTDQVEQIGIQRTFQAMHKARIVLWLIDAEPTPEDIQSILEETKCKSLIIIQNKIDKQEITIAPNSDLHKYTYVKISAKSGIGLNQLEKAIFEAANIPSITDSDVIITNARHYESLLHAQQNLSRVLSGLNTSSVSGDLLAEDLRLVLSDLAEITGRGQITTNEVLENIFTHFCVGK
ncbi:MAG: tRNA uridine-5-carboxymethylaminomethyl(34) synthesis GTPase MnmE, partial [Prevotella sp.]|nr:tRNA uridine-5-carboxymethylaminomethyl(34) synthesis GTPase MnmE [Prevotella sp.]